MVLLYAVFATHPQRGEYSRPPLAPAVIAPQHRRPVERLACAAGLPRKSVGGREQVSLSPALSSRPACQSRVKGSR